MNTAQYEPHRGTWNRMRDEQFKAATGYYPGQRPGSQGPCTDPSNADTREADAIARFEAYGYEHLGDELY